ncbi:copper amine oxidase N-terminal domain-containing protein [Paenibacillus sophorae]|nr:copper amine oxidase N-terminal domain-containing protein [Paenibacillus sophorae]QWU14529.1 copper amine oxidase N-terminal domain-containing protein [Paenibacillus sophorae]
MKINQYYVLYTTPKSPYLDNGKLYLPLRAVSELLGGKAVYDSKTKLAKIEMNNHVLEINTATNQTTYDGEGVQTDIKPQIHQQSLFVPIRTLVEGLKVNGKWDQKQQMFIVTDDSLQKTPTFLTIHEFDATTIHEQEAFFPLFYTFENKKENDLFAMSLTVKAQNITGADIPAGEENLHPTYLLQNGGVTYIPDRDTRPAVKKDAIVTRTWKRTESNHVQYILFEGRTGKDRTIILP